MSKKRLYASGVAITMALMSGMLVIPSLPAYAATGRSDNEPQEEQPIKQIDQQKSHLEKQKNQQFKLLDQQKKLVEQLKNKQQKIAPLKLIDQQRSQINKQTD